MATRNMNDWQTSICQVISNDKEDKIIVRGHDLNNLIDDISFAGMMFLMLQGRKPTPNQARVLESLLVASMEHGIAPPSMVARCFASYGTSIQAAISSGINAFGDRMGGLGEQMAKYMVDALQDMPSGRAPAAKIIQNRAATLISEIITRGERVPGFGIPLHKADPRAIKVLEVAKRYGTFGLYGRFSEAMEAELTKARGGEHIPMNLDGVSAAVILDLGFDWRSTRMFLLTPRSVSFGAHFLEEQKQNSTWRHIPPDQIEYQN